MKDLSSLSSKELFDVDPLSPDIAGCPYKYYTQLQDDAPVFKPPGRDFFIVSRYEDVIRVLKQPDIFSNDFLSFLIKHPEVNAILSKGMPSVSSLSTMDAPEHQRFRSLVNRAFTPARVNALVPAIEAEVDRLIDAFIDDGVVDLVDQFAVPFTMSITADQLGVPRSDVWKFKRWSDARSVQFSLMVTLEEECEAARRRLEFQEYFAELLHKKRANPTNDIVSVLATTKFEDLDRELTVPEFLSLAEQLMTAGNVTTTHAIGSGMLVLLRNPELMQKVREDPAKIRSFVEEVLRLESPVSGIWRMAKADTEISGTHIPMGSVLHVRLAAANRDPRQFPCPEANDLERGNLNGHVAFGNGIHFCIGFLLARKELEIGFTRLLKRLNNTCLTDVSEETLKYIPSFTLRGFEHLHITFDKHK